MKAFLCVLALLPGVFASQAAHVNLWPLYCQDDDGVSIAWPLAGFESPSSWRVGTIFCDYGEYGVWPLVMDYSGQFVLLPFVVDKDFGGGAILPLAYADWKGDNVFSTVFPLYFYDANKTAGSSRFWAAAGLAGWTTESGKIDSHWLLPLWIRGRDFFWSIPWYCGYDEKDAVYEWFFLPLLSWRKGDQFHITPLAGWTDRAHWFAPFYYWNDSGVFCTALYGRTETASWLFPFYYKDEEGLQTPLFYYHDADNFFSPLYSRLDGKNVFLLGLAGFDRSGKHPGDWLLPLWYRKGKDFVSIPYGSIKLESELGSSGLKWWGLPLFTTESGCTSGFGIHPVVDYSRDNVLDTLEPLLEAGSLEGLPLKDILQKGRAYGEESLEWFFGLAGTEYSILSVADKIPLFVFDGEGRLKKGIAGGTVRIYENFESGNMFFLKNSRYRSIAFDSDTLERREEHERGSSHFLGFVWRKTWSKKDGGLEKSEASVFWRLWYSRTENGNTKTGMFPGLSFESRVDGYSKTSFLWRFYRNEKQPDGTREVDFLFLPVWR